MTRIQPALSESERVLVDQLAQLTRTKRSNVIRNAVAVYHWFVRQSVTGARIVARKPTGEEVTLQTPELAALEGQAQRLTPEELGTLAGQLATAADPVEAAWLRERLARGFFAI